MEVSIPRLLITISTQDLNVAILSTFQEFGYDNPTKEQAEAISQISYTFTNQIGSRDKLSRSSFAMVSAVTRDIEAFSRLEKHASHMELSDYFFTCV